MTLAQVVRRKPYLLFANGFPSCPFSLHSIWCKSTLSNVMGTSKFWFKLQLISSPQAISFYLFIVYMYMCGCMHITVHLQGCENNLWEPDLAFLHWVQTELRLSGNTAGAFTPWAFTPSPPKFQMMMGIRRKLCTTNWLIAYHDYSIKNVFLC